MEKLVVLMERLLSNRTYAIILGLIAIVAPVYFLKTLFNVWFGPVEVLVGFKSEKWTWLVIAAVNTVGFLTTLPAREKGRVIQIVIGLWSIEMSLVFLATIIR